MIDPITRTEITQADIKRDITLIERRLDVLLAQGLGNGPVARELKRRLAEKREQLKEASDG